MSTHDGPPWTQGMKVVDEIGGPKSDRGLDRVASSWTYRWAGLLSRIHGKSVNTKRLQQWDKPIDLEVDLSPLNLIQPVPPYAVPR